MTEIPTLIVVRGLPAPGSDEYYATIRRRFQRNFSGVVDFEPDYSHGDFLHERKRLSNTISGVLKEGLPVSLLALSGGAPFAVSTRSTRPEIDPVTIAAVSGRLNTTHHSGYRTTEDMRRVSPLLADAVFSLESDDTNLPLTIRQKITSYRVEDGDEIVHPGRYPIN
jgi:hypothetical protein